MIPSALKNGFCYLASAYSSKEPGVVEERMRVFLCTDAYLIANGVDALSPLDKHFRLEHDAALGSNWAFWKDYSTRLLSLCSCVVLIDSGEATAASEGVRAEVELARERNLPIFVITPQTWVIRELPAQWPTESF